ncbi:MAG: urease accessory protein UreD [Caldimonas sp.]
MSWHGSLSLRYRLLDERTIVEDRHDGPLRVLKQLHPEGSRVCHSVLVHPPGGIVGGDTLAIDIALAPAAHALVTTPGATRFYRSTGAAASQMLTARAETGARLEWLPLETIAYSGCIAENRARFDLAPGAEMIGWDLTALGLPASGQPFVAGSFTQSIELPGRWLERGTVRGDAPALLDSPLGWAGHRTLATLWFAAGNGLAEPRRDALLEAARAACRGHALAATSGAPAPHAGAVVVRVLAANVEPAMGLLSEIWSVWRRVAWQLEASAPRVWRT